MRTQPRVANVLCRVLALSALISILFVIGCGGGGGGSTSPPPVTYTIGGTVSGLTGSGLVLQNNGGNNLSVSAGATTFTFSTAIASGSAYSVTVLTQPSSPTQNCAVANGSGTASANVTSVQVTCTTVTYTIGGTVSGLTGSGLVLQDNGTNNLSVSAGATTFTFSTAIASGSAYSVTVLTQPAAQICSVQNGTGTVTSANVTSVQVTCTTLTYTIGGTVSGLTGSGLVLQDNGTNSLSVSAGATTFTFSTAIASGSAYSVTVLTQPAAQICSVQNGSGTVLSANVTSVLIWCITPPAGGSGALTPGGGTVSTAAATVTAPSRASLTQQNVTIATMAPPPGLPKALASVGAAVDVSVDSAATINAPFLITLPYNPTWITDENEMAVVHYDTTKMRYEPVTILSHDTNAHSFQIESRVFSPFVIVTFDGAALDSSHAVTDFSPASNGWNINNFGSYFAPGGNCLGMSAYATWYFHNGITPVLNGAYSASGVPSIAQLVAIRAHLAQSQYWAEKSNTYLNQLGPAATGELMKMYLDIFDQPLILLLGKDGNPQHASVLYGYNANSFQFYDVNVMNTSQSVDFDGTNFGTYGTFNNFTYDALPSLGRTEDFAALTAEAVGGFTSSSLISVTSPTPGEEIAGYSVNLTGTLSSSLTSGASVIAYVKGIRQSVENSNGSFSATLPIANGDNTIVLVAGVNIGQQSDWYQNAATLIFDVTGTLPPATLLTTLTWDQDDTDVDLYVTEPAPSNQTAWYLNKQTTNLLTLDFDNTTGYGPEHTTLTTTGASPGVALPGDYTINVHYFSDHDTKQTVTGTVSIVVNEGMPNQALNSRSFTIATSDPSNASPGSTGADWVAIGTVNLIGGSITLDAANARPIAAPQRNVLRPYQYILKKPVP